jgi:hypothetical protein
MGQAVLLLILFGAAGLLSATQAWAIAARPASRVRYVGAWLVSTTGLAMLVLLVFGAGDQKLPRDIVRTTMVLAAITAAIAPWAGHRVAAPAGLRAAFVAIAKAPAARINEWAKQRGGRRSRSCPARTRRTKPITSAKATQMTCNGR